MGTYVESKIITLTSQSATSKRNGDFLSNVYYELGLFLKDERDIIHRQITLQSAQIPYSFYVINYTNNIFRYRLGTGTTFTSTIPPGNYNGNSLITALNTALTSNGITLTISLSSINGKLTFTHASQNFTFFDVTYSILSTLGFLAGTNYTSTSNTLTAPYPLNLLGIKVLQIRSSILNTTNYSSIHSGITTLIQTIPVSAVPFGMIDYKDNGNNRVTFTNATLDELDIEILDGETGEFINFNNEDWTMTFVIYLTRLIEPPVPLPNYFVGATISPPKDLPEALPKIKETGQPPELSEGRLINKDLQELQLLSQ